ncbi:FGGY-family carbohydrate kinase [Streptomyces sp. NPDC005336]|uniref:FGGY-family carbohydrate kinase n=1 Tax=Streptomyces sp. NPDC005336 TaxID=3157035 RepID=UPI0033BBC5F2
MRSGSADPLFVGVDVSTGQVRALCCGPDGTVHARAVAELPSPVRPQPGAAEQDARSWWPATVTALMRVTTSLGPRRKHIRALAITSTSGTVVAVDRRGRPLGPAVMYDDARARSEAATAAFAGRDRWARLGVRVGPTFGPGRIARLLSEHRGQEVFRVCHTADLLAWRLVGAPTALDWSHALRSGYDVLAGEWALEAFDALGADLGLLPTVLPPTTPVGAIGASAAARTGLPRGCEIRLGMTDGCTGQLAGGGTLPGSFVSVLGTTLVVKGISRTLIRDPGGPVYSHRLPDGHWMPGGASNTGGEALATWPAARRPVLDAAAQARGPASVVCYPLARTGERFPFAVPEARGFTTGIPDGEVDAYRAALEGVAFVERLAYDCLGGLGAPVNRVFTAGGGNRSEAWLRIRATVLGRPIEPVARAESAFGAAMLASVGSAHRGLPEATAAMVRTGPVIEPCAAEQAALEDRYGRFVAELAQRGWWSGSVRPEARSATGVG